MRHLMKNTAIVAVAVGVSLVASSVALAAAGKIHPLKPTPALMAPLALQHKAMGLCHAGDDLVSVGGHGAIFVKTPAGDWQQSPSPVQVMLTRCSFADADNGWAVGHSETILHTTDGGQHWTLQHYHSDLGKPLMSVVAVDDQHAVAVGAFDLLLTTDDGGQSWSALPDDTFGRVSPHLFDIDQLANGDLLATGEQGLAALSQDGGQTWHALDVPYQGSLFGAISWGDNGAMVYGIGGAIYVTNDVHDPDWIEVEPGGGLSLFGGIEDGDRHAVLVGLHGRIIEIDASLNITKIGVDQLQRIRAQGDVTTREITAGSIGSFTSVVTDDGHWVAGGEDGLFTVSRHVVDNGINKTVDQGTAPGGENESADNAK